MIKVVQDENCVSYVQIPKYEYADLIAAKERMSVLKDYMISVSGTYPSTSNINVILGIKEGEK